MGLFDWMKVTYRPAKNIAPVSADELRKILLALNRPTTPFVIRDCTADDPENADLVAEWRMREPNWYAVFGSATLRQNFQIFMRLLPESHEVQSIDRTTQVTWSGGIPSFEFARTWSRGQQWEYRTGIRPFYETTASGERIAYRFSSSEIKKPMLAAVTGNGWTWRRRFMGRLPAGSHREILRSDPNRPRSRKAQLLAAGITMLAFVGVFNFVSGILRFTITPHDPLHPSALASAPAWAIGAAAGALAARLVWTKLPKG